MSSSKGRGSSAAEMLEILPPELLRFLMVKTKISQQINFDPSEGDTIPKLFDEYQIAALDHKNKEKTDLSRIFELAQIDGIVYPPTLRFQTLTQWVQMPNMEEEIKKEGLSDWVPYVKLWVERYAPDSIKFSIQKQIPDIAKDLSEKQKAYLKKVVSKLDGKWDPNEFQKQLYNWAKEEGISSAEGFQALYLPLIGKNYGPKAGWLILKHKDFVKKRFLEVANS